MYINDISITSLETISAFHLTTGNHIFTLDELQNATIANTQEKTDVTGKGGRKLTSLKRNKGVTVSGTNGLVSGGLMEVQTGGKFVNKTTEVLWTDYLTVKSAGATTNFKAVGTSGNEIESVYVKDANGVMNPKPLTQDSSVSAGKFTYDPGTKALKFHTDITDGTEIVVYYKRKITADVLENLSDSYSQKCTLYIDALGEDKCGNVYRIQFYIPKVDFNGEFSLELGDNQTVHGFEAESLSGACGTGAADALWTYTVFGANTADAA